MTAKNTSGFLEGKPPCRPGLDSPKRRAPPTAWQRAEAYGIDVSLLEANLRRSVAERLRRHDAALCSMLALRAAVQGKNAKHG